MYTLSRTVDENLTFYLYSEWDGMKAYGEHFKSSYLREFLETIAGLNVVGIWPPACSAAMRVPLCGKWHHWPFMQQMMVQACHTQPAQQAACNQDGFG